MIQERYQPDVMFLSAGNPEPKAEGNIVQHQLDRLKELWETVPLTTRGAMCVFSLSFILCSMIMSAESNLHIL